MAPVLLLLVLVPLARVVVLMYPIVSVGMLALTLPLRVVGRLQMVMVLLPGIILV